MEQNTGLFSLFEQLELFFTEHLQREVQRKSFVMKFQHYSSNLSEQNAKLGQEVDVSDCRSLWVSCSEEFLLLLVVSALFKSSLC